MGVGTLQSTRTHQCTVPRLAWLITSQPVYGALKPQPVVTLSKVVTSEQQGWAWLFPLGIS